MVAKPANGASATADALEAVQPPLKERNRQFSNSPTTIFEVMSKLAAQHKSVNLGQGFPDDEGPESMKKVASSALYDFSNQYPSMVGVPELREAVARHSSRFTGVEVDPATEVLVTVGATEGIAACLMGLVNPGDEVVVFEPLYDSYVGMCVQVGGVLRPLQLQPPNWSLPDIETLEAAFSERTKLVLVNTPHNPTGKVFTRTELELIASLLEKYNAYALLDEVYEHLVHPGGQHLSLATLPGMHRRCLRVGSAGKTFSFTAWKVGWLAGPRELLAPCIKAHQFLVFTVPSSLQQAVAFGLDKQDGFYRGLGAALARKRSLLEPRLVALGFSVLPADGTYFLVADAVKFMADDEDDFAFCRRLTQHGGVTLIPVSAFYSGSPDAPPPPRTLVRFCFCKDDLKLTSACERLEAYLAAHGGQGAEPDN